MPKYTTIKNLLRNQIKNNINYRWAWNQSKDNEEFICIYIHIPKWSKELYSAQQLLNKLDESNNSI